MKLEVVRTNKQKKDFLNFRKSLYKNDNFYVSTIEYTFKMIFNQTTDFAKTCIIRPIYIEDNHKVLAEAILIKAPNDDFLQIAFFEALENQFEAVALIKKTARVFAKENHVNRIIVGLYGHLSYGVGFTIDIIQKRFYSAGFPAFAKYANFRWLHCFPSNHPLLFFL